MVDYDIFKKGHPPHLSFTDKNPGGRISAPIEGRE
jgi:hypothetical protein